MCQTTAPYASLLDDPGLDASDTVAALCDAVLDQRLAAGCDSIGHRELTVRAWQITRPRERERLATALDAILIAAETPQPARSWAEPGCPEQVNVARGEIVSIVERLPGQRPLHRRGVALMRR